MAINSSSKTPFDASALQSLQSRKHLELLDIIDNLRAQGLNEHVDLPQLIVCGDQSSGKSSVLAAVSGVPFPKKDVLCTRFATEVILRRDDEIGEARITVSIVPSSSRAPADKSALDAFKRELSSIEELPLIIEEAGTAMGLGSVGGAFSSDILRLEVRGPNLPQLTMVDLPGLVHSESRHQSEEDIKLVTRLVEDYMVQERSIILAIISARYDYPNQIVTKKARKVDPRGRRTLGIITKPDTLFPKSTSENSFLALAKNQDIHFSLGWHVVRNLDQNEPASTDRDAQERAFFKKSQWDMLEQDQLGIHTLRDRLGLVLFQQIRKELPGLISQIEHERDETNIELLKMGRSRVTASEKQLFVVEIGQKFRDLCYAACEAHYNDDFFQSAGEIDAASHRLRAVIQNRNIDFSRRMLQLIPRYTFQHLDAVATKGTVPLLTRAAELIRSHRGKELPGTFNPLLVGQLFCELSHTWLNDTAKHVESLWLDARSVVVAILNTIADEDVSDACMKLIVDPQLEKMRNDLKARLGDYMQEYRRQPITYNHYLTETVQKVQENRFRAQAGKKLKQLFQDQEILYDSSLDLIIDTVMEHRHADMDTLAAQNLADYSEAYYTVALKRLVDEVPAHVIEPAIMDPLPKLMDSTKLLKMSDEIITAIGGESEARANHREALKAKLDVLNRSHLICQVYAQRNGSYGLPSDLTIGQDTPSTHSTTSLVEVQTNLGPRRDPEIEPEPESANAPEAVPVDNDSWANLPRRPTVKKIKKHKKKSILDAEPERPPTPEAPSEALLEVVEETPNHDWLR